MQHTILEGYPQTNVAVLVVWVPMLASDTVEAAHEALRLLADPRAEHFYDKGRRASAAFAAAVGGPGQFAWDSYLFYGLGPQWTDVPPTPDWWMHQLDESGWADPSRRRWGEALSAELRAAAAELLAG